ncbi:MAG: hypothetical protein KY447_03720 [Actinobacteria bacterium]|nr:hypothetical protein [Actinomycetota bacterium]
MYGSYEAHWDSPSRLQLGVGSHEPSWNSPSRLTLGKRYVSPSARKHVYGEGDEELEPGAEQAEPEEQD